jgi:hypothetical protein
MDRTHEQIANKQKHIKLDEVFKGKKDYVYAHV